MTVRQQAALWGNTTVVVHMHGASLGNYLFLPSNAVTVQLTALPPELDTYNAPLYTRRLVSGQGRAPLGARRALPATWRAALGGGRCCL